MNELVEFIRARLAEQAENVDSVHCFGCAEIRIDGTCDCGWPEHLKRDIEAKRAMLADCLQLAATPRQPSELEAGFSVLAPTSLPHAMIAERFLRRLASEWDTHEAYRAEWRL